MREGNKSHLFSRMAQSTSSLKRTCYFTPQGLSSMWCHGSQPDRANRWSSLHQQPPSPSTPEAQGRAPLLKWQHAGCNKHEAIFQQPHAQWWHKLSNVATPHFAFSPIWRGKGNRWFVSDLHLFSPSEYLMLSWLLTVSSDFCTHDIQLKILTSW